MSNFEIPEIYFDLFYPGQYRRKIKAMRITIPCVTGPYVNVSATLTLTSSWLRNEPKIGADLKSVPLQRSVSIASSKAQNDAGVFEFSFRDERYMPFEGAGVISNWQLSLPKTFRQFDYQTISDVILHISYIAEEDGNFRGEVERVNAQTQGALMKLLTDNEKKPLRRLFSLRHEFPSAFHKLIHSAPNTPVEIELTDKHFPIFLKFLPDYQIRIDEACLILKVKPNQTVGSAKLSINNAEQTGFAAKEKFGNLLVKSLAATIFGAGIQSKHTLKVVDAANLTPAAPPPGDTSAIDASKLLNLLLYFEYGVKKKE